MVLLVYLLGCAQAPNTNDDCVRLDMDCEAGLDVRWCCEDEDESCSYRFSDGHKIDCGGECDLDDQDRMSAYCWEPRTTTPGCVPERWCCRICSESKACGDSCIDRDLNCNVGDGCACNAWEVCP
jgi:hypothetical protein